MDSDRILELIDDVLPFEVCLYYRVIPLKVTPDRVHLGMVEPDDLLALEYLNQLFHHVGRNVVAKAISMDAHQFVMSSYLDRTSQRQREEGHSPPPLDWLKSVRDQIPTATPEISTDDRQGFNDETPPSKTVATSATSATFIPRDDLKLFEIQPEPPHLPVSMLVILPPDRLLPALLAQVLSSGIGRLFFERREKQGSILYSQDGVRQSVLDALPVDLFEDTLDRLKQFMELDAVPEPQACDPTSASPKDQRESDSEFIYRDERVLLRLRVMSGNYGEEATLQVLRGKAMEFYQEKKIEEWSLAAVTSAKLLKFLVRKIRSAYLHRAPRAGHNLTFLPQLEYLLDQLETEMEDLSRPPISEETTPIAAPLAIDPTHHASATLNAISRRLMR